MSDIGFMSSKAGMDMAAYGSMQQVSFANKLSLGKLILGAENSYNRPLPLILPNIIPPFLTSSLGVQSHFTVTPHTHTHTNIHIHSYSTWYINIKS